MLIEFGLLYMLRILAELGNNDLRPALADPIGWIGMRLCAIGWAGAHRL
jgi:hypothetical protein